MVCVCIFMMGAPDCSTDSGPREAGDRNFH